MTKDKFQTARDERAEDESEVCWCAGYTCSGCEANTKKLWVKAADWAREFLGDERTDFGMANRVMKERNDLRAENAKLREASNVYFNTSNDFIEILIKEPKDPHAISQRLFIGPGQGIDFSITPLARAALGEGK